jgi:hypothetical protein
MNRETRRMDECLPPVKDRPYNWAGLCDEVKRVDEMLSAAKQLKKTSFMVEGVPSEMLGQVAEVFRGRGYTVLKGRVRLLVEVVRDE